MAETRKGKGNVMKIVELGLDNRVYNEMKKPGFSAEALARELTIEGIPITAQSIRKFIKNTKTAQQKIIQQDLQVAEQVKALTIDYTNELKSILDEVQEVKNEAKDEKDLTTYNQLIGRIFQGIELLAKLSGDIKPKGSVDINIIYQEINTDIERQMRDVKKDMFQDVIDVDAEIIKEDKKYQDSMVAQPL